MQVGDLVMYNYGGHPYIGVVLESHPTIDYSFLVYWHGKEAEWEFEDELEVFT